MTPLLLQQEERREAQRDNEQEVRKQRGGGLVEYLLQIIRLLNTLICYNVISLSDVSTTDLHDFSFDILLISPYKVYCKVLAFDMKLLDNLS